MKKLLLTTLYAGVIVLLVSSCNTEDLGPIQYMEKDYSLTDFDRLEMGSGFHIAVTQSPLFRIHVSGDARNINDLNVFKNGSTLTIQYDDQNNRRHDTYITIEMPVLYGVNFSGGSVSTIKDFESDGSFDFILSGASVCQLHAGYKLLNLNLSGASRLSMDGLGDEIHGTVSGASSLSAYDFPVSSVFMQVTGASKAKVTASQTLNVTASGASEIIYKGNPLVQSSVTGDSRVQPY